MVFGKTENLCDAQNILPGHDRVTNSTLTESLLYFSEGYIDLLYILGHYWYLNMN